MKFKNVRGYKICLLKKGKSKFFVESLLKIEFWYSIGYQKVLTSKSNSVSKLVRLYFCR